MQNQLFKFNFKFKGQNFLFYSVLLTFFSAFLFALANPGVFFNDGLGFVAWFYYLPLLASVKFSKKQFVFINGFLYGFTAYFLYTFWLLKSYKALFFLVIVCFGLIFAFLFFILKLSEKYFGKIAFIADFLILSSYEFLRTLGPFGLNYGVTCYTQYNYKILIQIADISGPFGLNLLMIFTSCVLFEFFKTLLTKSKFSVELKISSFVWGVLMIFVVIYGLISVNQKEDNEFLKITAIQSNENPWENGIESYSSNLENLIELTEKALEDSPESKIVVWPETAVVPDIVENYFYPQDSLRNKMSKRLLEYIDSKNQIFVIGNGHKCDGEVYNSALIFKTGKNVIPPNPEWYAKVHLVPFTEYFPFEKILPSVAKNLENNGAAYWKKGEKYKSFEAEQNFVFSTPICFEDTFSDTGRKMFKSSGRCFINLSNDSWSFSQSAQKQHLAMAIFRCVENRIPGVRSTTSGETCIIDCKGNVTAKLNSFCAGYLNGEVEIHDKNQKETFYTKTGDWAGWGVLISLCLLLISKIFIIIMKKGCKNG